MRAACQLRALLLGALIGEAALAQTTPAQAPVAQSAPAQAVSPAPPPDDFELLPPEKAPDPAEVARGRELSRELSLRRSILGPITASKEGQPSQRDFALAHQVIGYTTLAATATGFAVLVV